MIRRFARWVLRSEISERIDAARTLSDKAYQDRKGGERGRVWWNGYLRALEAFRDGPHL